MHLDTMFSSSYHPLFYIAINGTRSIGNFCNIYSTVSVAASYNMLEWWNKGISVWHLCRLLHATFCRV